VTDPKIINCKHQYQILKIVVEVNKDMVRMYATMHNEIRGKIRCAIFV
jgi:hypothetical protein